MARLLAEGTGAQWAQVWLPWPDGLTLAATWPPDADDDSRHRPVQPGARQPRPDGRRTSAVRHGEQVLGVLRLQERAGRR